MSKYYLFDLNMHCQFKRKLILLFTIASGRFGKTVSRQNIERQRHSSHVQVDKPDGACTAAGEMLTGQVI